MLDLFQRSYSFRAIIYTNDPVIVSVCDSLHIMTDGNYELFSCSRLRCRVNIHKMPIMRYMYMRSQKLFNSHYYGYINSDIIVAPNLFAVLKSCKKLVEKKMIKPKVGRIGTNSYVARDCFIGVGCVSAGHHQHHIHLFIRELPPQSHAVFEAAT